MNTRVRTTSLFFLILCLGLCCIWLTFSCKSAEEDNILEHVYIKGIHDDPEILRADSFFLKGKLDKAAELFVKNKSDVSRQLYCQARLAEMDYYLRELYGENHINHGLSNELLPPPNTFLDSFYCLIYKFYHNEKLDTIEFRKKWDSAKIVLGDIHYLIKKKHSLLGEFYYKIFFDQELLDFHFTEHFNWYKNKKQFIYDCYWTNIRLTSSKTYARNHLESIAYSSALIDDQGWKMILDSIHLAFAYCTRGYIAYRFDKYDEAFADNLVSIKLTQKSTAVVVYQEAIKSQLTVTNFWGKDSLWRFYIVELERNIQKECKDYVNFHRHVARFYHERNEYQEGLKHHKEAIEYCMAQKYRNEPVLNSLCHMYSTDLEKAGYHKLAIDAYRLGDVGYYDTIWKYDDLLNSEEKYNYVSLVRYGHIYFTWFLKKGSKDLLHKAEELALLAHTIYFKEINIREENTLIALSYERNMVHDLLCLIYSEKYIRFHDGNALHKYHQYAEENRGSIFWRDVKLNWNYDSVLIALLFKEQYLKSEIKRLGIMNYMDSRILTQKIEALQKLYVEIKQGYPDYYRDGLLTNTPSIDEIQSLLMQENTSILSFDIIDDKLFILWLNGCEEDLFKIELSEERMTQIESLEEIMSSRNLIVPEDYSKLAYSIWQWLIPGRIKDDLNKSWVVIPDGIFYNINFEAIITRSCNKNADYSSLDWLILEKELIYSPLIKSWILRRPSRVLKATAIVGMGWSNEETIHELQHNSLPELPGSLLEMQTIREVFPKALVYTGHEASKKHFIEAYTNPNISMIHLAIHGHANSHRQDDLRLYFRTSTATIDTMYGYELLPLKSNVQTIILSACQTGAGKMVVGEGNFNLPRYFLANGINRIYASLWNLNDRAVQLLFKKYYEQFDTSSNGNLRLSKIQLIKNSSFDHPFYWGSLIVME